MGTLLLSERGLSALFLAQGSLPPASLLVAQCFIVLRLDALRILFVPSLNGLECGGGFNCFALCSAAFLRSGRVRGGRQR